MVRLFSAIPIWHGKLNAVDVAYLDHGGTTLYAQSLITRFADDMKTNLFGNPHSASPSSELSTSRVEDVRLRLLSFFKADPEEFDLVFVANATAATKVVVDAFRDVEGGFWYGYHRDAHTSLVGPRELAAETRCFESDTDVEEWIEGGCEKHSTGHGASLFAYPAQSNMNGHRTPLSWSSRIRNSSPQKVYTLLDAAAYVMTAQLDLSDANSAPDFTTLSFYKIFGFPNLGALIIRKSAGDILRRRRYFGGGTVEMVVVLEDPWHAMKDQSVHEYLEDGTLPFHQIIALDSALNVHKALYGCMDNVSKHTCALALQLYSRLSSLRHANGQPVCAIYKDATSQYGNAQTQGPTLAFNLRNSQGGWIGKSDVEKLAILHGIHLRTGGVCNPGGIAIFCQLASWELRRNFAEGMRCGNDLDTLGGKPTGIVRVSLGAMSSTEDVERFVGFVEEIFMETKIDESSLLIPMPAAGSSLAIEKLQIFPVVGCRSWQIPELVHWEFGPSGLAWDQEWYIISLDGRPLDPRAQPRMAAIETRLDLERGTLTLAAPKIISNPADGFSPMEKDELTISLWDIPPTSVHAPNSGHSHHRPADAYRSPAISSFLTAVLGLPCTLARVQHPGKTANAHGHHQPPVRSVPVSSQTHSTPITLSTSPSGRSSNISIQSLSQNALPSYLQYLRIGTHYFQVLKIHVSTRSGKISKMSIKYLPSPLNRTLASQNPTISTSSPIHFFPTNSALQGQEPGLAAAIVSSTYAPHSQAHACPVWYCRRGFSEQEDLDTHLHIHGRARFTQTSPAPTPEAHSLSSEIHSMTPSSSRSSMDTMASSATDMASMDIDIPSECAKHGFPPLPIMWMPAYDDVSDQVAMRDKEMRMVKNEVKKKGGLGWKNATMRSLKSMVEGYKTCCNQNAAIIH
jgi:molybdenum cofactor sulfurtransferase